MMGREATPRPMMSNVMDSSSGKCNKSLPLNYTPHEFSVICRMGEHCSHTGNERLKVLCRMHSEKYTNPKSSRGSKSAIVSEIVSIVRASCGGQEGFVKYKDGQWWRCTESHTRRQVTAALRDCHPDKYPSSTTSKVNERSRKRHEAKQMRLALAEEPQEFGGEGLASSVMSENEDDLLLSVSRIFNDDDDDDDDEDDEDDFDNGDDSSILTYPYLCMELDTTRLQDND